MSVTKNTEGEKAEVRKKSAGKPAGQSGGFCVYLGPSIRGVITHGKVISGSKAEALEVIAAERAKYPLIGSLVVTGEQLPEARVKVKTPGNLLYVNYRKLAAGK